MIPQEALTNFALGGGFSLVSIGLRRAIDLLAGKKFASNDPRTFNKFGMSVQSQEKFDDTVNSSRAATEYFLTTGITNYIIPLVIGFIGLITCVIGALNGDLNQVALAVLPTFTHGREFILNTRAPRAKKN